MQPPAGTTVAGQDMSGLLKQNSSGRMQAADPTIMPAHLKLEFRYSHHGIPSFITSPLPQSMKYKGVPEDFLWISVPPGPQRNWGKWWDGFRSSARRERGAWEQVQIAMGSNSCFVEVTAKPGREWAKVPADGQFANVKFNFNMTADSGSGDNKPRSESGTGTGSGTGSGSGGKSSHAQKTNRGKSGLRNEVQQE